MLNSAFLSDKGAQSSIDGGDPDFVTREFLVIPSKSPDYPCAIPLLQRVFGALSKFVSCPVLTSV